MSVRFAMILCLILAVASCHKKPGPSVDLQVSVSYNQPTEEVTPVTASADIVKEDCEDVQKELAKLEEADEDDAVSLLHRVELLFSHPSCDGGEDSLSSAMLLANVAIKQLAELHPNAPDGIVFFARVKIVFALRPELNISKTVITLIDIYQSIDEEDVGTIVYAFERLHALETSSEFTRLMNEAILREALVYSYRHQTETNPALAAVIGTNPFDRVKDRLEFSEDIVDCFEAHDSSVIPPSFFADTHLNAEEQQELLTYAITPDELEGLADELDVRAKSFVVAGHDLVKVKMAVIEALVKNDLFADALAFANKRFDAAYVSSLEDRLTKILRERGCYTLTEDADGRKVRKYDFTKTCGSASEEVTEE